MKISWILWWVANAFWVILFSIGTLFVWTRKIDGAGAIQTTDAKLASFIVLVIAFALPFLIQLIWMIINLIIHKNKFPHE